MKKPDLTTELCSTFCSYYKPGKDEALACRGYLIIEKLLADGKDISFGREKGLPGASVSGALSAQLCSSCPFFEDGCDFAAGAESALPCGGFILIGLLLEEGIISVDDVPCIN